MIMKCDCGWLGWYCATFYLLTVQVGTLVACKPRREKKKVIAKWKRKRKKRLLLAESYQDLTKNKK